MLIGNITVTVILILFEWMFMRFCEIQLLEPLGV